MNHAFIGEAAGILAIIQVIPYIVSILKGHTKPERTTYLIWFVVESVGITSYIAVGARTTIWTPLVFTATGLVIFLLSLKYGVGGFSKFDIGCLALALLGLVMWLETRDALLTLYFTTAINSIGYLPTIKKAYFLPETENTLSWAMTACTGTLNLFALTTLSLRIALPPVCGMLCESIVAFLVLFPHVRFRVHHVEKQHRVHAFLSHPMFAK